MKFRTSIKAKITFVRGNQIRDGKAGISIGLFKKTIDDQEAIVEAEQELKDSRNQMQALEKDLTETEESLKAAENLMAEKRLAFQFYKMQSS
jgi:hypothetical protein